MLDGGDIPDLVECMDTNTVRVYTPIPVVFLCGGQIDATSTKYLSLRDAFLRFAYDEPFGTHNVLLAEELNGSFPNGQYDNILKLEADIAQISDLTVLFSESFGSVAELGAFAMVKQIAANLLVIVDDRNYNENSFIKLGPITALENQYGESAVCVINRNDINIPDILHVESLNLSVFKQRVNSAIKVRLSQIQSQSHTTFDRNNDGHLIKFVVGLIQHYGSLRIDEIATFLGCIGIDLAEARLADYLLCAQFAKWIIKDKRGLRTYYSACSGNKAIGYTLVPNSEIKDRKRWQSDIREHWRENDPDRFSSINYAIEMSTR